MARAVSPGERSLATETERIVAWLRLPAIGVLLLTRALPHPNAEPAWFYSTLALFGAWAVFSLVWTSSRPTADGFAAVSTVLDIAFFTALTALSGGPFSNARFAYVLVPVTVAFRMRPRWTALASASVIVAYVVLAVAHPAFSNKDAELVITVYALFLVWVGGACVLLSMLLARRTQAVSELLDVRTELLSQVVSAEERERRVLAEALHDSALQNLLAARQELDELDATQLGAETERLRRAIDATVGDLRSVVVELHPYVLDEVGLGAAVHTLAERAAESSDLRLELELGPSLRTPDDTLLYSVARELIWNVVRHADATVLRVQLDTSGSPRTLAVEDDGQGLDPLRLGESIAEGHIGLPSQRARVEAAGGTMTVVSRPGLGTRVEVAVPATP